MNDLLCFIYRHGPVQSFLPIGTAAALVAFVEQWLESPGWREIYGQGHQIPEPIDPIGCKPLTTQAPAIGCLLKAVEHAPG